MKTVNYFNGCAGLGANVHLLKKNVNVTSVEMFPKIADANKLMHPEHEVITDDAFKYFQDNHENFDFAWFSP